MVTPTVSVVEMISWDWVSTVAATSGWLTYEAHLAEHQYYAFIHGHTKLGLSLSFTCSFRQQTLDRVVRYWWQDEFMMAALFANIDRRNNISGCWRQAKLCWLGQTDHFLWNFFLMTNELANQSTFSAFVFPGEQELLKYWSSLRKQIFYFWYWMGMVNGWWRW